jgi:hypothetical protein
LKSTSPLPFSSSAADAWQNTIGPQVVLPIMSQKMEAMRHDVQQQVAEMIKQSEAKPGQNSPTSKD